MTLNLTDFKGIKTRGEALYKSLAKVHCPYFGGDVHFNALGLEHTKFKRHRGARRQQDQYMRFKLIHLAPKVLRNSKTLQGYKEGKSFERVRTNNRMDIIMKDVKYYEFVAVLEEVRVKIIVKQVDGGQKYFWSIIPFWGKNIMQRKLHSGNPEED